MSLTITLITPPDIFENDSPAIFLMNLTENQQDEATKWLADCKQELDINIYFSQNEPNPVWFLHAMANSSHKYINLDNTHGMGELLAGYVLGKSSVYYSTVDKNKAAVFSHINQNRVDTVKDFFERVLSEERQP
jgi:hypothetical protein